MADAYRTFIVASQVNGKCTKKRNVDSAFVCIAFINDHIDKISWGLNDSYSLV
jgi:hypothetical protein